MEGFFFFLRENRFVTDFFGFRIEHGPRPVGLSVIRQLQGVAADENFCRPHKVAQDLPVITEEAIPLEKMEEAMEEIRNVTVHAPVQIGTVILDNLAGTGVKLTASRTMH